MAQIPRRMQKQRVVMIVPCSLPLKLSRRPPRPPRALPLEAVAAGAAADSFTGASAGALRLPDRALDLSTG